MQSADNKGRIAMLPNAAGAAIVALGLIALSGGTAVADADLDAALRMLSVQPLHTAPTDTDRTRPPAHPAASATDATSDFAQQSLARTKAIADAALANYDRAAFAANMQASAAAVDALLKSLPPPGPPATNPEVKDPCPV
jgi:hypothetical protein